MRMEVASIFLSPVPSLPFAASSPKLGIPRLHTSFHPSAHLHLNAPAQNEADPCSSWDTSHSSALFRVNDWGFPYFTINNRGHVAVRPTGSVEGSDELDIVEIVEDLKKQNIKLPVIIRFSDILRHRLYELQESFAVAREKYGYKEIFQGVFPIKCNYDSYLLDSIVSFGKKFSFGLEVGSKPELLIAIAKLIRTRDTLLVCNGYKDMVYIETVLFSRKLNINAIIVLEQMEELDLVIKASQIFCVRPVMGVRARLSTHHNGHWGSSSGDNAKFGLTISDIVKVMNRLREENMLDCLQLLHFHIGSQVSSICTVKEAMREAGHIYCELALMGAAMGYIDVGGGLGIDYDGTKSSSLSSTNYSMQNYANDVVAAIMDACILKGVHQPIIISESGRALASHQSVIVFDVLGSNLDSKESSPNRRDNLEKERKSHGNPLTTSQNPGVYLISTFDDVYNLLDEGNLQEAYNDAKQFKLEATRLFKLGGLSLEQRAQADALYDAVCHRVLSSPEHVELPDELIELRKSFAAVYHINLSVFRSVPDTWAIGQVFPIMPLQRLNERPETQAVLADLTCDSDGKIDRFISANGKVDNVLPVHRLQFGKSYYMGLFLAGVYQEVLGSAHNLFGTTNVVYIKAKPGVVDGGQKATYIVEHVKRGDTMKGILEKMQPDDMWEQFQRDVDYCVSCGYLSQGAAQSLVASYRCCLNSYTYMT